MRLHQKSFFIIGLTAVVLLSLLYTLGRIIMMSSFDAMEERWARESVRRVSDLISAETDGLSRLCADWAAWDDTYAFIDDGNSDYLDSNIVPSSFSDINVSFMVFAETSREVRLDRIFDVEEKATIPLQEGLLAEILAEDLLFAHQDTESSVAGFLHLAGRIVILASRPIVTSDYEGPIRGTLIFGRFFDEGQVDRLRRITHHDLWTAPWSGPLPDEGGDTTLEDGSTEAAVHVSTPDNDFAIGHVGLRDINGEPALILRVRMPREIHRQGRRSMNYFLASLLLVGSSLVAVSYLLLQKEVLNRLSRLSRFLRRVDMTGDLSQRLDLAGSDELSEVSQELDSLLSALDLSSRELEEHRSRLEERVAERTADLERANRRLELEARERQKALEALVESEERYRTLIKKGHEGILVVDPRGPKGPVILEANRKACEMHGYSMDEMTGKLLSELNEASSKGEVTERAKRLLSGEQLTFEVRHVRKNGSVFPLEISACLVLVGGEPRIISFERDITERKNAEEAIKLAKEDLERQNTDLRKLDVIKDAFISDVTHELKTPVAKHVMQLEILRSTIEQKGLDPGLIEIIEVMEDTVGRQQNVIRNILVMSRLEAGGRELQKSAVDVKGLLNDVILDYSHTLASHGIEVVLNLGEDVTSQSDRELLWHVLANIVSNAIKYRCTSSPRIEVSTKRIDSKVEIRISDNGIGMSEEEISSAFERFYQRSTSREGIGLGLYLSRTIMERLSGTIGITSEGKGGGVSVTVTLPPEPEGKSEGHTQAAGNVV